MSYSWSHTVWSLLRLAWIRSLGCEDPLEKGKSTHSSILTWRIPWIIQSMGSKRVGQDWATSTFTFAFFHLQKMLLKGPFWASLVAQRLKHLPAVQETRVWSLGQEDPLEDEMATHSSILAWRIPWTEELGRLQSMWSQRVGHDWAIWLSLLWLYKIWYLVSLAMNTIPFSRHDTIH